jgi:type I restriction enzyme S subunit
LREVCRPRQWKTIPIKDLSDEGFLVYGGNGLIGKYGEYNHEKPVIAVACRGEYCGSIHLTEPKSYITGNSMCLDNLNTSILNQKYLFYYLFYSNLDSIISGSAQPQIIKEDIERYKVRITDIKSQIDLVAKMDKVWNNISEINSKISSSQALLKSLINQIF